jgi:hypothetical protein
MGHAALVAEGAGSQHRATFARFSIPRVVVWSKPHPLKSSFAAPSSSSRLLRSPASAATCRRLPRHPPRSHLAARRRTPGGRTGRGRQAPVVAEIGHTDQLVIADADPPTPPG